jgi:hypothetical protein
VYQCKVKKSDTCYTLSADSNDMYCKYCDEDCATPCLTYRPASPTPAQCSTLPDPSMDGRVADTGKRKPPLPRAATAADIASLPDAFENAMRCSCD